MTISEQARQALTELILAELTVLFDRAVAAGADRETLHVALRNRAARLRTLGEPPTGH